MMDFMCLEHYDNFGDSIVFWCEIGNVTKEYIDKAYEIDGTNFSSDCFGCCVILDKDGWNIISDNIDCELYYTDNNGYKHWLEKKFDSFEREDIIRGCLENLTSVLK